MTTTTVTAEPDLTAPRPRPCPGQTGGWAAHQYVAVPTPTTTMRMFIVAASPPQRCGSALFAGELHAALSAVAPGWHIDTCGVDPNATHADGPARLTINRDDRRGYRRAAQHIAASGADLVVIAHQHDAFGGPNGAHLLDLTDDLRRLGVPYVVTLHAVPAQPRADQRAALAALCHGAARITTFTGEARRLLHQIDTAIPQRTIVLPRGAPTRLRAPFHPGALRPVVARTLRRVRNTRLLTTLRSTRPDGGLDVCLAALPTVGERHPTAALLVVGADPPGSVGPADAAYRRHLAQFAARLGILDHVQFLDAHLTEPELAAVLARTDVFVSPHRTVDRDCSGPLTYALAAGRPVVSTAYRYAVELLTIRARAVPGAIVPCGDVHALAKAIDRMLGNPTTLAHARAAADALGAGLAWHTVAIRFAEVFAKAARPSTIAARCSGHLPYGDRPMTYSQTTSVRGSAGSPGSG